MHYLSIDYLIVYVFLLVTLIVGWRAGRGVTNIKEYALGNRAFGTAALVLTFLATEVGGQGVINIAGNIGTTGVIVMLTFLSFPISYIVQALWIAPKMVRFPHCMTMGDIMGELYGGPSQVITGIFSFIITICASGAEVVMLGVATQSLLGIDARIGMIVGGLILTLYVVHGGIKSVTTTDVLQFLVLLVLLPVLAATALQHAGGIKEVLTHIPRAQLDLGTHPQFSYYLVLFLSFGVFHFNTVDPALIQRMLMAKSGQQLRHLFLTLAGLFTVLFMIFLILGTAGHQLYPTLAAADIVPHMIQTLLPTGIRGLMMAGVIAVVMASADSYLQTAGLALVHDVIKPLYEYYEYKKTSIDELKWIRYATLFAGILIISLGFTRSKNLYSLVFASLEFATPLLVFPFFAGILGLKPDRLAFYLSAAVTLSVFLLGKLLLPEQHAHFLPIICVVASGIVFFGVHFLNNHGFAVVRHATTASQTYVWQPRGRELPYLFQRLVPTPKRMLRYSQQQVAKYGAPYLLFGTFCCINFTLPYFMWAHGAPVSYDLMLYLRVLGGLACGLLIVRDKWPASLLSYLPTFWHLTLLYCLPFTSTVMFLLTQGSMEWLINVAITIIFLIVLVDWISFVLLATLGLGLGLLFYKIAIGPISLRLDFSTGYLLVYQGIFATLIGLIFARRKQLSFDKLATDNQALLATELVNKERLLESFREKVRIIQTLKHAGIQNLLQVARLLKDLRAKEPLSIVTPHIESTLIPMALQLQALEHRATDYLRLQVETLSILSLLERVQTQLLAQGKQQGVHYQVHVHYEELECDASRLTSLLVNSITDLASPDQQERSIQVVLEETQLHYPLPSVQAGYIKKVAALRLTITTRVKVAPPQASYTAQMNGTSLSAPESARALLTLENQRIVKAHYGYSSADQDGYHYVIPVYLGEVRPSDMDKPYMELGVAPMRADDHYPGAQAQEQAFLAALSQRTKANLATVQTVLELIKWYHGPMKRQTGEPFYLHPLAVAQIVLDYNQEEATVLAALLHDTVEDTSMLLTHIEAIFGKEAAAIVDRVTHLESSQDSFYKIKLSAEENILMLLEAGDDRAMYVKIADRIHNMRTIEGKSTDSQARIAKETLQFFVPQAQRLGLHEAAKELKERCVKVLNKTT